MLEIPRVGIVGRPNVGKSTLFNILTGSRKAVVKNQPGVTRDFQVGQTDWCGVHFEVLDTGGMTGSKEGFAEIILAQAESVLQTCGIVIVILDAKAGLCPEDKDVLKRVRRSQKPFLLVVNKVDRRDSPTEDFSEYYALGEDFVIASFENRRGIDSVLEWIVSHLETQQIVRREGFRISVVGKPNTGKSSLVNRLLGQQRVLVSEKAGTTVDSIETAFVKNGKKYLLVDTAGLRRKRKRKDDVEILASFKTRDAIKRTDFIVLLIDVQDGPTDQDARIVQDIMASHKGVIIAFNKCDLAERSQRGYKNKMKDLVRDVFHFYADIPLTFLSAKTGKGVDELFRKIDGLREKLTIEISTKELNDFFSQVIRKAPAPVYRAKDVQFYYLTQTKQVPPSFIAFANYPDGVDEAYRRFVIKHMKARWDLEGIPIRLFVMPKGPRREIFSK